MKSSYINNFKISKENQKNEEQLIGSEKIKQNYNPFKNNLIKISF